MEPKPQVAGGRPSKLCTTEPAEEEDSSTDDDEASRSWRVASGARSRAGDAIGIDDDGGAAGGFGGGIGATARAVDAASRAALLRAACEHLEAAAAAADPGALQLLRFEVEHAAEFDVDAAAAGEHPLRHTELHAR